MSNSRQENSPAIPDAPSSLSADGSRSSFIEPIDDENFCIMELSYPLVLECVPSLEFFLTPSGVAGSCALSAEVLPWSCKTL